MFEFRVSQSACVPGRSTLAAIIVGSALSPGCARRPDGAAKVSATATVSTRVAASALPSSQPPPSAQAAALPPPHKLDLSFEITRDPSGEQTLWGTIPSLRIRQAIGRAKPPLVCGVASQPPGVEPSRRRSRVTVADCGDEDEALPIKVEGDTLLLGTAEMKIPERSFIVHEELTQPLPPERDCSKAAKAPVSISVKRDAKGLRLAIPALHVTRELTELEAGRPLYCRTTVLKLARRMDVLCGTGQLYSVSFHLGVKRDVLFVETRSEEDIDDLVIRRQLATSCPATPTCASTAPITGHRTTHPRPITAPVSAGSPGTIAKGAAQSNSAMIKGS